MLGQSTWVPLLPVPPDGAPEPPGWADAAGADGSGLAALTAATPPISSNPIARAPVARVRATPDVHGR